MSSISEWFTSAHPSLNFQLMKSLPVVASFAASSDLVSLLVEMETVSSNSPLSFIMGIGICIVVVSLAYLIVVIFSLRLPFAMFRFSGLV